MSHSSKLMKPKEGAEDLWIVVGRPKAQVTTWACDWCLKGRAALWDWALYLQSLIPSLGRECQDWVKFSDTLLASENRLLVWGSRTHVGIGPGKPSQCQIPKTRYIAGNIPGTVKRAMWLELTEQIGKWFRHKSGPQDVDHVVDKIRYILAKII